MSALLAVDGGQSGTRMAVVEDGRLGPVAEAAGLSHGAGDRVLEIAAAVADVRAALALEEPVERICLGLTGVPGPREVKQRLGALISARLDGAAVALGGDMVTAHAGALGGEAGVVVAAGTGAVVLGVDEAGAAHRADGLGYLLGDEGGGFAIGRAGVRAALRAREARGPATALEAAAAAFFGGLDDITQHVYSSGAPVRELAAFTPAVASVARAGDTVAQAIWNDAVDRLAVTTASVVARTFPHAGPGSVALSHSGRLFEVADLLLEPYKAAIAERCPAVRHRAPLGDSLAGAARLVEHGLGRYAELMHVTAGGAPDAH